MSFSNIKTSIAHRIATDLSLSPLKEVCDEIKIIQEFNKDAIREYDLFLKNIKTLDDETKAYWSFGKHLAFKTIEKNVESKLGFVGTISFGSQIVDVIITYAYPIKDEFFDHLKNEYENNRVQFEKFNFNLKNESEELKNLNKKLEEYKIKNPNKKTLKITRAYKARYLQHYLNSIGQRITNLNKAEENKIDLLITQHVKNYTIEQYELETYEGTNEEKKINKEIEHSKENVINFYPNRIKYFQKKKNNCRDILLKYNMVYYIPSKDKKKLELQFNF